MDCYISNPAHSKEVLSRVQSVKHSLWIGTADIKDLYIEDGKSKKPFLEVLAKLIKKGVAVRLIHAKEPGPNFREDFDRFPILYDGLERVLCPRVHFKMMVFDGKESYIGSANLTGGGIGMKGDGTRNFEAGILTDDPEIVGQAMNQFDEVWMGKFCKTCKRLDFCIDPIV
jgi:phosphatidylserine/phosphatidylglycerophosphate/cardiolipin synthase-like enzyme